MQLAAIPNFRDTGGLTTRDGGRVRTGLLYRSVALDAATDADLAALASLGIRTVIDLRTAMEQARKPDRLPAGARLLSLDLLVDSGEADPAAVFALMEDPPRASTELRDGGTERFYLATYRDLVRLPSARDGFARFYRTLARADARPVLVHCTTGKDRTGWAVASLLLFLGVPREDVMAEYLASDLEVRRAFRHVVDDFVAAGGVREVIEPLMSVHPTFLEAALEVLDADYGSIEGYFREGLALDESTEAALRDAFLEPADQGGAIDG
jgi:protein-tyrosine phosphatase